jgi:hypothetical protein
MVYIYEKDLNTNKSKVYMKMADEKRAKAKVADLNEEALFYDKFYYIGEKPQQENS